MDINYKHQFELLLISSGNLFDRVLQFNWIFRPMIEAWIWEPSPAFSSCFDSASSLDFPITRFIGGGAKQSTHECKLIIDTKASRSFRDQSWDLFSIRSIWSFVIHHALFSFAAQKKPKNFKLMQSTNSITILFSFWRISKRKLKNPNNDCSSQLHNYFRSQKLNFQLFFCCRVWLQMIINSSMKKASAKWNFPDSTAILLVCNITDLFRNYQSHQEQQQTRRNFTARKVHGWRDFTFGLEKGIHPCLHEPQFHKTFFARNLWHFRNATDIKHEDICFSRGRPALSK